MINSWGWPTPSRPPGALVSSSARRRTETAVAGARGSSGPAIAARKPRGGGLTDCPRSRDRDCRHAAQPIAPIGGAGRHDFPRRRRDDGRDALSVRSPRSAGHRGSRGPEHESRTRSAARPRARPSFDASFDQPPTTASASPGRSPRPPSSGTGSAPPPPAVRGRRRMAAAPSAPARWLLGPRASLRLAGSNCQHEFGCRGVSGGERRVELADADLWTEDERRRAQPPRQAECGRR